MVLKNQKSQSNQLKRAVVYARYSSDAQTEQSIEGQLRVCQEYAARNDIIILGTYIDRAMTGTNDNRPDFQRMIKDSAKKQWDFVLVYKLDRFSRDKYEATKHKHTLKENGVKVISATESIPDTPEGIILESLLEGMNQYYSAELSQKVKRGMRETRLKGNFQGGHLLYGYKLNGRKIVKDEETAPIVLYIYEEYSKGRTVASIINSLNAKGIQYKGKPLASNTVYGILKNEKYSGIYMIGEEIIDNMYPQIVPMSICNIVREKMSLNKYGKKSVETVYILRNKMKCGYCGQSLIAECGKSRKGDMYYYYKCHGRKNLRNGCKQTTFKKEVLEEFIIDSIVEELSKPSIVNLITKKLLAIQEQETHTNPILDVLLKEQKQTENALNNLVSAIEQGIISNTTNKRLHELENRLQELEKQIIIERNNEDVKLTEKDIKEFYEQALRLEPLMLINYLVKEIIVYEDTIHIYYKSPLNISPDESQGFSFYQEKRQITVYTQITHETIEVNLQIIMTV